MKHYILLASVLATTMGCSMQIEPLTYHKAPQFSQVNAYDVQLHNSQIDIDLTKGYSDKVIANAMRSLVNQGGHFAKQRYAIKVNNADLSRVQQRYLLLMTQFNVLPQQVVFQASNEQPINNVTIVAEYFESNSVACNKTDKAPLGCASANLLSAMVVDPATLIRGKRLGNADGVKAVNAVKKYQQQDDEQTPNQSFRVGSGN